MSMKQLAVIDLGRTSYKETWDLQRQIFGLRLRGDVPDILLLTEHHHVFTIGKTGDENHLLASGRELSERGVEVFNVDRGGDVTYHGPGQLVGYPIIDLHAHYLDLHRYLRDIEEVIIQTLAEFQVQAHRDEEFTGVWVGNNKIAAIGVKVNRWVTMHGFALNIDTDLTYFERIIPCGIFHKGVTSLQHVVGKTIPLPVVSNIIRHKFADVFNYNSLEEKDLSFVTGMLHTFKDHTWQVVESL